VFIIRANLPVIRAFRAIPGGHLAGTAVVLEPVTDGRGVIGTPLTALDEAASAWVGSGRGGPVARWLSRELDPDGVPRRLPVSEWAEGLRLLAGAVAARPAGWPDRFDAAAEGWFRALLRFSRPDGSAVFGPREPPAGCRALYRAWADRLSDPGLNTVLDWWFPRPTLDRHAPPPLPADARPDRALAVLRANWVRDGDFLAVDHRAGGAATLFELTGSGRTWLGPSWDSAGPAVAATRARPTLWVSHSSADVVEWSFRVGPARVVRTAILLRGRRVALLGEQWDGPGDPGAIRLALPDGVEPVPIPGSRGLILAAARGRAASARVFPVGLPRLDYPTDRGRFGVEAGALVLRQAAPAGARRVWRPLLVSWDARRNRQAAHWRTLTVSEDGRECAPGVAFAARVTWGRDETLVIYRGLAGPGHRAFLGHQTRARLLVGLFTAEGEVEPLVKVDD